MKTYQIGIAVAFSLVVLAICFALKVGVLVAACLIAATYIGIICFLAGWNDWIK